MARKIPWERKPLIMGVLNVTPDSFFDGGRFLSPEKAVTGALDMIREGADIIDVGGESTRPFSQPVSQEEETERVVPVIKAIREQSDVLISIDTNKSEVARQAVAAGADIINDISAFTFDGAMAGTVAECGVYGVIMHMKGTPGNMQENPFYDDVISEIREFFVERVAWARDHGVKEDRLILDPGIGFGKRINDNLRILKLLHTFRELDKPLLVGTSMKSFIGKVTDSTLEERREGTLASVAISLWNGADIVRVHDVKGARKVTMLVDAVMKA